MANQIKAPINYPVIAGGKIVSGGSVIFGQPNVKPDEANPSTLKPVYLDAALTQPAENPQGLSSDGVFDQADNGVLFGTNDTVYSIVIKAANGRELSYIPEYDLSDANAAAAAQDSAAAAASSESNALTYKNLVVALYNDFVNRYFGAYSSNPTVDAAGNPPQEGSIYFNSTSNVFFTWTNGAWVNHFPSNPNGLLITATGTTTPRTLGDRFGDTITPLDNEAVGDGVADDTAAVIATILDGRPVDWLNLTYKVTSAIVFSSFTGEINWRSSGATIKMDSVSTEKSILEFISQDNENTHTIKGKLTLDCNNKAQGGIVVSNTATNRLSLFPAEHSSVVFDDLRVVNTRKTVAGVAAGYTNGDGIWIKGAFKVVNINRPEILNTTMEAGAGVFSVHGISGITVSDDNEGSQAHYVKITDPYIEHVVSDDDTYYADQDAIRVFTDRGEQTAHTKQSAKVTGGTIRNSRGRAVKLQTQSGHVSDLTVVRTSSIDPRGTGLGDHPDIDFQTGGGSVNDIEFFYDGFAAPELVRYNEDSDLRDILPSLTVDGLIGTIFNGAGVPEAAVKPFADSTRNQFTCSVDNVQIIGEVESIIDARVSSTGDVNRALISGSNIYANCTETFVDLISSGDCEISLSNCHNTSGSLIPSFINDGGNEDQRISMVNCSGFNKVYRVLATEDQGNITRVDAIATRDSGNVGLVRPFTLKVAAGATGVLEKTGYNAGNCILLINAARGGGAGADSGIFSVVNGASGNIYDMSGGTTGGRFSIGNGSADPGGSPADYVMWVSSDSSTGVSIRNTTASEKIFVGMMIG